MLGVLVCAALLATAGCSAVPLVALRINGDGTVNIATCEATSGITSIEAYTSERNGPNNYVDEESRVDLIEPANLTSLDAGEVVTFSGMPDGWERLDIYMDSDTPQLAWILERDDAPVGDWYWNDGGLFDSTYPDRCELDD
jgi:hypothetical protein